MLRPKTKVKTKVKIKTLEWYQWYSSAAFTVRGSHQRCSVRKYVLRDVAKFTGKHLCQSLFFDKDAVEACEFCEISKTTFFIEHLQETAFVILFFNKFQYLFLAFLNMLVSRLLFAGKRSVFSVILRFVQTFLVIFLLLKVLINISYCLVLL